MQRIRDFLFRVLAAQSWADIGTSLALGIAVLSFIVLLLSWQASICHVHGCL